jgi:hypothetical protein
MTMLAAAERLRLSALPGIGIFTGSIEFFESVISCAVFKPLASLPKIATTERSARTFEIGSSAEASSAIN